MTAKNKFQFTQGGKKFEVPTFTDLPMGVIRKSRKAEDDADRVFIIIEEMLGEGSKELDAIDAMTQEEFTTFITEWTQGAGLGES